MGTKLTGVEGVRHFLDEVGHLDGHDDDGETDELDRDFERALLSLDPGHSSEIQDTGQQEHLDGQETGYGGVRHELFHGGDSRCTNLKQHCARRRRVKVNDRRRWVFFFLFWSKTKVPITAVMVAGGIRTVTQRQNLEKPGDGGAGSGSLLLPFRPHRQ